VNEADYIDWYEVAEAVANGRLTGHVCPKCGGGPLDASTEGANVRMRCPDCSMGFEGRLAYGRDDGLYAEAAALSKKKTAEPEAPEPPLATTEAPEAGPAPERRGEPWEWQLPAGGDEEGLAVWMPVVEAIYNGRRTGLRCPFCSEALDDGITVQAPHFRVVCAVCSEGFEGRLG